VSEWSGRGFLFTFGWSFCEVLEVEVLWEKAMGQGTEGQPVRPGGGEVGHIHPRIVTGNTGAPCQQRCLSCQSGHPTSARAKLARFRTKPDNKQTKQTNKTNKQNKQTKQNHQTKR